MELKKLLLSRDNLLFPVGISLVNAFIFLWIVHIETKVDSQYENIAYGLRNYPLGDDVCYFSVIVFILTFLITRTNRSALIKAVATSVSYGLIILILLRTNFYVGTPKPEFPNMGIVAFSLFSETALILTIYVHYFEDFYIRINNKSDIPELALIESIKLEYSIIFKFWLVLTGAFLAALYTMYVNLSDIVKTFAADPAAQTIVFNGINTSMHIFALIYVIFSVQILRKSYFIANHLTDMKRKT